MRFDIMINMRTWIATLVLVLTVGVTNLSAEPSVTIYSDEVICREEGRYIGWPSLSCLRDGTLLAVFSGERLAHICPSGVVQVVRSEDGGITWTKPVTIGDSPIDDRDASVHQLPDGEILVTWFTSLAYADDKYWQDDYRRRFGRELPCDELLKSAGRWCIRSKDGGKSWTKPERMNIVGSAPHGGTVLKDGSLLNVGRYVKKGDGDEHTSLTNSKTMICCERSTDGGRTWEMLCEKIPDTNGEGDKLDMFHEPHVVELANGTLIALIRCNGEDGCFRQTESKDKGRTWTPMRKTDLRAGPTAVHLSVLGDGRIVAVYGIRDKAANLGIGEFASISSDDGRTWSKVDGICLHKSFPRVGNGHIGYPATTILPDGSLYTVYYEPDREAGKCPVLWGTHWRLEPIYDVVGNYSRPHTAKRGETVKLNLQPGSVLGGGWRKALLKVQDGGTLVLQGDEGKLETVIVDVEKGGVFIDRLARHRGNCNRKADSFRVTVEGHAEFPNGIVYTASAWGKSHPIIDLRKGGEIVLGGDVDESDHAEIACRLGGGRLRVTDDASFFVKDLVFLKDTETEIYVEEGKVCDMSDARFEPGAMIVKTGKGRLLLSDESVPREVHEGRVEIVDRKPFRPKFKVFYDTCNRNYRIDVSAMTNFVSEITYVYPDEDSPTGVSALTTSSPRIRRRFPSAAKDPFVVKAKMKTREWGTVEADIKVVPLGDEKKFHPPSSANDIIVGICAYGKSYDLVDDILGRDLCNLYVVYGDWGGRLTKEWMGDKRSKKLDEKQMRFMTIYGGARDGLVKQLHDDWGERYLENNVGEYCGFLYQGANETPIKETVKTMTGSRDRVVERWIYDHFFRSWGRFGYHHLYSTSGSPLANYELQGGLEIICNELYALGAGNLGYATAEARGASRRWGPEYWSGWNAHDWQTKHIPYAVDQKYDQLYAGFLLQYAMGTSLIVLESGAQTAQAWDCTAIDPGKTNRVQQAFDDYAPRHYRDTVGKFYRFVKENPRDLGSPETKIAMVLGNTDGYVGLVGRWLAVWGNHKEAASNKLWRCGAPEFTFRGLEAKFYPCGKKATEPYGNSTLSGSPYGQVDVVCVDDESRLADVNRYDFLCYGGWNLMTPTAIRTLRKFAEKGGAVLIANPHFSTRDDREYTDYEVKDMIQPGLAGIAVSGRMPVNGAVSVAKSAPKSVVAAFADFGGFANGISLAKVNLADDAEVVASVAGKPLLVRRRVGKGWVWYWTGWEYPGADKAICALYADLAAALSCEVRQRVTIESVNPGSEDDDTIYCNYAVYGKKAYFVNLDCIRPRKVRAKFANGTTRDLEMKPCSITTIDLPKQLIK